MPRRNLWNATSSYLSGIPIWYAGIFVLALALRLYGISLQNIWYDEHWTLLVASAPINQLIDLLPAAESSKPPLYFAFMHFWLHLGAGEFWLRLPCAIFGACDCVAAAALGRQLLGSRVGLWLGWALVISPFQIYYSQEARPYALWAFLMTLTLLFHLKFCARSQVRFLVGYVVCGLLACYTFIYTIFILPFSLFFTLLYRPSLSKRHRLQMALANGIMLFLYLPWLWKVAGSISAGLGFLPTHYRPVYAAAAYTLFSFGFGMSAGPSLEKLRVLGMSIFREAPFDGATLIFGLLLLAVLVAYGSLRLWRTNRNAFYFSLLGLLAFWGTAALLNLINPDVPLNPRYAFAALLPLIVLILAACFGSSENRWKWVLPVLYLLTIIHSLGNHYFNPHYTRDDLRAAARFIRELEPPAEGVVICAAHLADIFRYYSATTIPLEPLSLGTGVSVEDALAPIKQRVVGMNRFALVYSRPDHGDPEHVLPGAMQACYRLVERRHWTGVDVYLFEGSTTR